MLANIIFFLCLFFLLGIFSKHYYILGLVFVLPIFFLRRKPLLIVFLLFSFLLGVGYYSLFDFIKKQKTDDEIFILKEFSSTNYYHKYLGEFRGEKYFIYLPYYYERIFPKDKIRAEIEISDRRIFIKNLIKINHSPYKLIYKFRKKINSLIDSHYSLNSSEIIGGVLYGREINDRNLKENFKNTGLSHITAMSGYNLVVISSLTQRLFRFLPFNFLVLNFLSIVFILLFIIFTGFQSSVIRAGIMVAALIISKLIGKPALQRNILIFTALLISVFDPRALIEDLGFQLSILATIGIIYLEEYFRKFLKFKSLSEIISAQILVIPFLWYKFGELNIFSFLNNALLTPIIPFLMLVGLMALILFFIYPLNYIFNLPFEFFAMVINLLANLPKIYFPLPLLFTLVIYFYLAYLIIRINKNERIDFNFSLN